MTNVGTVQLQCDRCRAATRQGAVGETIHQLRDRLADVGWLSDKASDADLCPSCIGRP